MRYHGGKTRISKEISEVLNNALHGRQVPHIDRAFRPAEYIYIYIYEKPFVSLFCGACSIESKIKAKRKILNDKHEYLIEMLRAVQSGYELPDTISEEQYRYIREHRDDDKALSGFVGFACSFGGKWFGSYARGSGRNYAADGKHSMMRKMQGLQNAEFLCMDYRDVPIPENAVVYADPPYAGTTGYTVGKFDSSEFWEYMRVLSEKHLVFISEQTAPEDFIPIWEKELKRNICRDVDKRFEVTEKLFVHQSRITDLTR